MNRGLLLGIIGAAFATAISLVMAGRAGASTTPNDTYYGSQWSLHRIRTGEAWDVTRGSSSVRVAVVSTGVDVNHPDLGANLVPGYNAVTPGAPYGDMGGGGTMMAGIIGAVGNNANMVSGINWTVSIIPVRACDSLCAVTPVSDGIRWAADAGADIIVVGAAFENPSPTLESAVVYAQNAGAILVAASADVASKPVFYPAAYSGVTAVGATDSSDAVASFTSRGAALDLVAPGVSITSTWPGSQVSTGSGTHLAAAHATGVMALLLAAGVPPSQVTQALTDGAVDLGAAGWDTNSGWGRIDACAALSAAGRPCPVTATATPTRTNTPVPPTATPTRTNTPVPPTATPTRTNTPVPPTATPTWTSTAVPPTATPTRTSTPVPPTATPTRTNTPVPPTMTPTRTNTPVAPTSTPTASCPPGKKKNNRC